MRDRYTAKPSAKTVTADRTGGVMHVVGHARLRVKYQWPEDAGDIAETLAGSIHHAATTTFRQRERICRVVRVTRRRGPHRARGVT